MTAQPGKHDGAAAWLLLARFADAIERDSAEVSIAANYQCAPSVEYLVRFTLSAPRVAEMVEDASGDALAQTAERLSVKWGEVAVDLGQQPDKRTDLVEPCSHCGSQPGEWCRPTHDGERASSGLWSHPARRSTGEDPVEAATRSARLLESIGVITASERSLMIERAAKDAEARSARDGEKQSRNAAEISAVAEAKRRADINRGRDIADEVGMPQTEANRRAPNCACVDPNRRGWTRDGRICPVHPW